MKSVHNKNITKEEAKKMVNVGTINKPVNTYTKDDYLTAAKLEKKFDISTTEARKKKKKLNFKRAVFALNGHKTPVIVRLGTSSTLKAHPMAMEVIQQEINKQKVK